MQQPEHRLARPNVSLLTVNGSPSDADLVVLSQRKNAQAFELLVKRHQRSVFNLLYQLAPDWNNTADMTQEVFIRAWRSLGNLRNPKAFRSWLNQIATNMFYDELRKRPKQLRTVSMDEPYDVGDCEESATRDIPDTKALPDEFMLRKELLERIRQAIKELPEQFRTAIVLRELKGLTYEEIAELTNSEMGTVKSRIARARTKIQEVLNPYLDLDAVA